MVDSERPDYRMLLVHHVLAICMIGGAYWGNAHRCAVSVCVEQDFSDIVLYFCKVYLILVVKECKYFRVTQQSWLQTILVLCICVSWAATRIVILGWILVYAYLFHVPSGILHPHSANFDWLSVYLVLQLTMFLGLQLVWWIGILGMTYSQVFRGSFTDVWHDGSKKQQ
jgi:hypothetical protein